MFLHGYGERGVGTTASLQTLEGTGLPQLVATHKLPAQAQPFVILMPQTNDEEWSPQALHAWLATVLPEYRVDKDRTYLTGLSIGGGGVVNYLQTYGDAGEFAAMVPISEDFVPEPEPLAVPHCAAMDGSGAAVMTEACAAVVLAGAAVPVEAPPHPVSSRPARTPAAAIGRDSGGASRT